MQLIGRVLSGAMLAVSLFQLVAPESVFAQAGSTDTRTVPQPGEPKPSPYPDPYGCRKQCGSKSCCLARTAFPTWDAPNVKSGAYPSAQVPYVKPRDPLCSRIDIVALQGNQSALNVKGRTLGHFDGLRLKKSDGGQAKFESGQLAFMPQVDPKSPPAQCPAGPVPPLTVNTEGKQLIIDGVVVGTFDAFSLTADNLAKSKTSPIFALWKSIQVDASKPRVLVSVDDRPGEIPPFTIPGSIGAGSGGTAGIGGVSPTPPKQIHCTPGQGRVCPD